MIGSGRLQVPVHIRWMIRRDMAEVLEIERAAFEFPWFEEEFIRCLRQRNCIGMVAEHGERAEQEGRDGRELGRQPQALRIQSHAQHITGEHRGRDRRRRQR